MHLVQLFLPLHDNDGVRFSLDFYRQVRNELVERFGGVTAYTQAPASGLWQENEESTVRDDLVIYEVMTEDLDPAWWSQYRSMLEMRFRQEQMVIRAHEIRVF